ncbi:hypothetical protein [Clostridium magnum]|uniref:Uncharacterized protein n=1 Tax=Clostridium magnum DSM 2767 TaxID=1121326 RepID=A0A162UX23_9CLOT|nr:hypothetical protein [Clostridium magnum]KZL94371.1 hypothetical protein CLMAG_14240 [Clostridium magnum DSM 2767]SHJ50020.1 hypothetical protein SAMN02745944_06066 [Clostridium magnum DSM 2767]
MRKLKEKDLYCIAKHIQEFVKTNWCKDKDSKQACYDCNFNQDCTKNGFTDLDSFDKLEKITGVKISFSLLKNKNSLEE